MAYILSEEGARTIPSLFCHGKGCGSVRCGSTSVSGGDRRQSMDRLTSLTCRRSPVTDLPGSAGACGRPVVPAVRPRPATRAGGAVAAVWPRRRPTCRRVPRRPQGWVVVSRGLAVIEVEDRVREVDESDPPPVVVDGGPHRFCGAESGVGGVVAGGGGDRDGGGFLGQPGPQVAFPDGAVQPEQHRPGTADLPGEFGVARQLVD